jgi:hypothetical protein
MLSQKCEKTKSIPTALIQRANLALWLLGVSEQKAHNSSVRLIFYAEENTLLFDWHAPGDPGMRLTN